MSIVSFSRRAVSVAALLLVSFGAQAQNVDTNLHQIPNVASTFSDVVQKNVGFFTDNWLFEITGPTAAAGSVSNLSIVLPPWTIFNITGLSAQLYGGLPGSGSLIFDLDTHPDSTPNIKVGSGQFVPGHYYFNVTGTANGSAGGQYVFAVTTLPVPEPESYAMLLAGLGVMGAIALRRRKANQG